MARFAYGAGRGAAFLGGVGLGAGAMYVLDPGRGARRRAMARDKASHLAHAEREMIDKGMRDLRNRGEGLLARARRMLRADEASDQALAERVRAKIGRCVTHPGSIHVMAMNGRIVLSGPVLEREVDDLLACCRSVRGAREVENHTIAYPSAEGVPGLQGRGHIPARPAWARQVWPPGIRLLATGAGLGAGIYGLARGGAVGTSVAAVGGGLLLRATINKPFTRLAGIGAGRRAVDLRKTITVNAPIEEVYRFWERFENFPRFMEHVRDVRVAGDGRRSHWAVEGPTGVAMKFEAEITARIPNQVLAWRSLPNQTIENAGIIHFERLDDRATRIDIQMSYNPPAGAVGHAVAKLFHKDPKSAMDDDLVRMKSLLEEGKTRAHGHRVTQRELH